MTRSAIFLLWLFTVTSVSAQQNQCRTSPVGASTSYCASEAFVTQSRGVTTINGQSGPLVINGAANIGTSSSSPNTITSSTTISASDYLILCDATSGAVTVTLPSLTNNQFYNILKKDNSANACKISGLINGASSFSLTHQFEDVSLQWNGASWSIL